MLQRLRNSDFRHIIWPIRSSELYKFLPMACLMFTILLNQNIVRSMKDSIVMTMVGPEVISFIKLWGELPAGVLFVIIYSKMCNVMTTERAFRYIVSFFLIFFALFAFVLFPYREYFHPDPALIEGHIQLLPNLKWFIVIWSKWSFVLFYIMGELWPIIVFSLLFWQLANKITKTAEAKRFYSFFSLFGQTNSMVAGLVVMYFASGKHFLMPFFSNLDNMTEITVKSMMIMVLISGAICLCLHYFIEHKVMQRSFDTAGAKRPKQTLSLGLVESFKMIARSKYLGLICVLMIAYSVSVNLIEGLWFAKAREMYPTAEQFMGYQGNVIFWTGVFACVCALLGSTIIRRFGWFWGAVITPAMIMLTGGTFFVCVVLEDKLEVFFEHYGHLSALTIIVIIGALQNILGKGTKYSLFDATKEMAYIPLHDELKTKGKAAVDVIGTKIGKSAGAIVQFITFTIFPAAKYEDIAGFLLSLFVIICLVWIYGVVALNKEYEKLAED
jgi:AAA family ATP:ADP antiporter